MTSCTERRFPFATVAVVVIASGLLSLVMAVADVDPDRNPHAYFRNAGQCPGCHVMVKGKPDPDRILSESDRFCLGCHADYQLGRSHPRGERPRDTYHRMQVPEEFRLDDDGRIVCVTCHIAHGLFLSTRKAHPSQKPESVVGAGKGAPPLYRTFFLRRSDPKDGFAALCDACHKYL